ncbi:MAG: hypothetical protein ACK5O7_00625 [Holosporales bacterium]
MTRKSTPEFVIFALGVSQKMHFARSLVYNVPINKIKKSSGQMMEKMTNRLPDKVQVSFLMTKNTNDSRFSDLFFVSNYKTMRRCDYIYWKKSEG